MKNMIILVFTSLRIACLAVRELQKNKRVFGVGINTPDQSIAESGLQIPLALVIDCSDVAGSLKRMQ